MKKISLLLILISLTLILHAQQGPTGQNNPSYNQNWSRTGNYQNGSNPTGANIFGTNWNSPIYTVTNGTVRTRLNGKFTTTINGSYNVDVSGYFGIGPSGHFATNSPMAMLHLEGSTNNTPGYTGNGWRRWMQTGTFMRENSDAMYVGLQTQPGTTNRSDAVINWSDDISNQYGGADRLKIVMSTYANTGNGNNQSRIDGASYFGYEFMQFTPSNYQNNSANFPAGFVGIGPVFTSTTPSNPNSRPQSRLHINSEETLDTWLQISNMDGTGQTQTDGFRVGITSDGTANLRQQENKPLLFLTDWDNISGGVMSGERLRLMSVGMPGVPNPGNVFAANTTRVAISHLGNSPITAPRSLLHLGYNTGGNSANGSQDGWRSWMDIGMFVSNGTDNVYLGLKNQGSADRNDAVLSWGDNQGIPGTQQNLGPDNLLFVFTATQTGIATPPASGQTGVEGMRMTPTLIGVNTGIGGNPITNPYFGNIENPTQTLEVNSPATTASAISSGLRFTDLNSTVTPLATNPGTGVLAVNANGDVVYVKSDATQGIANAENGCSVNTNSKVVLGNDVGSTTSELLTSREIPMNGNNILFSKKGRIGIGDYFTAGAFLPASKFDVYTDNSSQIALKATSNLSLSTIQYQMNQIENNTTGSLTSTTMYVHTGGTSLKQSKGIDVKVNTSCGENIGIYTIVTEGLGSNHGAMFTAGSLNSVSDYNCGIDGRGLYSNNTNIGGTFRAGNPNQNYGINNYGIQAVSWGGENCYGIYATATGGTVENYAGYFAGDIYLSGQQLGPSDIMLKENISPLTSSTSILTQLSPKNFTFKTTEFPQMNLPTGNQFGLIAQDVEQILPELVKDVTQPAVLDSVGNIITPAVTFKSVKYESFIPILIQGVKEANVKNDSVVAILNTRIDSLQNVISNFNTRMNQFENQLNDCCNNGHNGHHGGNKSSSNLTEVVLENSNTVLLEQNVPNPFAESTTINYYIPENIKYAQLLFSDNFGRIIKTVDIETSGAGTIKVYASNLSQGTYTYSLVVDGKVVETKKMVCVK